MSIYKPKCTLRLEVGKVGDPHQTVAILPSVISAKWSKNNHLVADELTVTIGWEEGGCDPRLLKNATCQFWMWDENRQNLDSFTGDNIPPDLLRFTGVCTKVSRKLGESNSEVTLTFNDYTTLFLHMTPFPTDGMPLWTDSLRTIWTKICDHVGSKDPVSGKIRSTVGPLRDNLISFAPNDVADQLLGQKVNKRFHAIDRPSIHQGANAWQVWQWCVGSLGLVSYIQGNECIIMTTTEHYTERDAAGFIYGSNILEFEENTDTSFSGKGVMLKSMDPLTHRVLEAVYPPPGDDRLKVKRAALKRATKEGRDLAVNDVSADYEEFAYPSITTQEALDTRAREAYEEFSRQNLEGTLKTSEMAVVGNDGNLVDILSLNANDSIIVKIDPTVLPEGSNEEIIQKLKDTHGYNDGLARIIAQNVDNVEFAPTVFHVTSMEVSLEPEAFDVSIKYHNLVFVKGLS